MNKKIDVYGLTQTEQQRLKELALERFGKASVSLLAKHLLKEALKEKGNTEQVVSDVPNHTRLEIQLIETDRAYLDELALKFGSTANMAARSILRSYISKHPNLSAKEIEVLYQSNGQLLRIGRNINQIVRQLNAMEGVNLTSDHIAQLHTVIDEHTKKVGDVLLANRRRFG